MADPYIRTTGKSRKAARKAPRVIFLSKTFTKVHEFGQDTVQAQHAMAKTGLPPRSDAEARRTLKKAARKAARAQAIRDQENPL